MRDLQYAQAIREGIAQCMEIDPAVMIMGLGVPDPKGVFGTTLGLFPKFGPERVMDMPTAENAMTGVAIGAALMGMRPILTHQRFDFALLSVDQIVNQAAKWHFMFGGKSKVPIVIRLIVGRGWGQGPQHSQSLHNWFAHVPGLKVVMPATPYDAKGLLVSSIEDNNPVIFIEHRWLHNIRGDVPVDLYRVPLKEAKILKKGSDLTIVALSYMVLESLKAAELLAKDGINAEVIDLRSIQPMDDATVMQSVSKTGRLIVADIGTKTAGFGAEVVARVTEEIFEKLKSAPLRISSPDYPAPTSPALAAPYYPRAFHIYEESRRMLGMVEGIASSSQPMGPLDVPDQSFTGPF